MGKKSKASVASKSEEAKTNVIGPAADVIGPLEGPAAVETKVSEPTPEPTPEPSPEPTPESTPEPVVAPVETKASEPTPATTATTSKGFFSFLWSRLGFST
jgi:hypothetical protein